MKIMSCFGKSYSKKDRLCEMCEISCSKQCEYCKELIKLKHDLNISSYGCEYKKEEYRYSERDYYYICDKFGGYCEPKEKCKKDEFNKNKSFLERENERMLKELGDL
ncbi:hypothetical protein [Terrisporobacter sp.]|uniref:hypothetical protein n=1 Tax=Terrisporobacter sp. TaxID=1965305 RepID=UPI00289C8CC3|nr:hypothetical protein [Terrisporobacter sp.]